jgi:solute carrier family 8 (sodium/calcium exchanger)|tara:strand:- start:540 stop:701 length:162 start_codon:yes stop_codon:yes gene_type:complete
LLINWKLLFSIIPPIKWGGGKYAFIVALTLIGVITGIVGEVAELIGCVLSLNP